MNVMPKNMTLLIFNLLVGILLELFILPKMSLYTFSPYNVHVLNMTCIHVALSLSLPALASAGESVSS
jgi:hypothetical protein